MHTLRTHFRELLKRIKPPDDRLEAAKTLPPKIRDYLKSTDDFKTVDPHTRLVGSYAQNMAVDDVKDVDFLVRVPGSPEDNEPEAKQLIQDLREALEGLPEVLGVDGWAGVDLERARRSVHVYIEGRDFHLDVVPCIAPDGFEEPLYVPDRGFNKWIPSHPVGYVKLIQELNQAHNGKVLVLGKLFKHIRNFHMKNRRPKSYWLGALLIHHVNETLDMSQPLAVLVRDLLDGVYNQYACLLGRDDGATPNIPDPLLGHNISWNWSRTHFETFMRRVNECRSWASSALDADQKEDAVSYWLKVFGEDWFPTDVEEAALRAATVATPGEAVVLGSGLVVGTHGSHGLGGTKSRVTRFHGDR